MRDIVKKSFLLGLGAASITKAKAEGIIGELVKKNAVNIKEGREMLSKVKKEADNERKRIQKFAEQEARRIAGKLGVMPKNKIEKVRRRLKSIDKELSNRGKKTLKKILKGI